MQSVSFILTVCASALLLLLTLLVAMSAGRSTAKRTFAALCGALIVWIVANYFADADMQNSLFWTRLTFTAVIFAAFFFVLFVRSFPIVSRVPRYFVITILLITLAVVLTAWSNLFIPGVTYQSGTSNVEIGPLYWVFVAYFLAALVGAITWLFKKQRHEHGANKRRLRLVLLGIGLMAIIGSLTNLILPLISGSNPLAKYGSMSSLIFVGVVTYAIVRHRLFNVRFVIARSLAYLFTLLTLTFLFIVTVYGLVDQFLGNEILPLKQKVTYVVVAMVLVLIYQPIKHFFDRLTRRLFFRDLYDPQQVIDDLGAIASRNPLPAQLISKTLAKLEAVLHPVFIASYIYKGRAVVKSEHLGKPKKIDTEKFAALPDDTIIVTEDMPPYSAARSLNSSDVAVIVRLSTADEHVGYLLFGYKRNGGGYDNRDLSLLHTLADELAVATQNALRFEEISRFNVTLREEINDATKKLRESNAKLQQLDQAKDEFISMASHQLRTPLTSVKGYLSMVLEGDAGALSADQRKLLQEAYGSSQRMVYLIGDFLNVSRLQTGKFVVERRDVDLAGVVQEEVEQLAATASRRDITLHYHKPAGFPIIQLDDNKIRQVLMNFIDNAIFYSHSGGEVDIELTHDGKTACFKVHDNGIGVPADERHKLFTKFYRASNARNVRPDGTGIGLFMAKKVVVAHGGSMVLESEQNKGSTFGFCVPLKTPDNAKIIA